MAGLRSFANNLNGLVQLLSLVFNYFFFARFDWRLNLRNLHRLSLVEIRWLGLLIVSGVELGQGVLDGLGFVEVGLLLLPGFKGLFGNCFRDSGL